VYISAGDNNNHVYALDLTASSSLVPRQVTTLTFPGNDAPQYCEALQGFTDLDDPASAFWLIGICDQPLHFVRIRLSDSASTAPANLNNVYGGTKQFLYHPDGTFAGMLSVDSSTFTLVMYHDDSFTTFTPLLTNCVNFRVYYPLLASGLTELSPQPTYALFLALMLDGSTKLYRRRSHRRDLGGPA